MSKKQELIKLFNEALEKEYAARIQYLAHAEAISGTYSESVIERFKEIAGDEQKHEEIFRNLIANYLEGEVSMDIDKTNPVGSIDQMIKINLQDEKEAVEFYKEIMLKLKEVKDEIPYGYFQIEHGLRHVIMDEEEHVAELKTLLE